MKKYLSMLLAVLMLLAFAGCGGPPPAAIGDDIPSSDIADNQDTGSQGGSGTGYTVSDSFNSFLAAKGDMIGKLSEGLSNNPDTVFSTFALLGVTMIDMSLVPVTVFGMGKEGAAATMAFFGASGFDYSESGNSYTISYKDEEGKTFSYQGTYNPAADSLVCSALENGVEIVSMEYYKTSFGYVAQYFVSGEEGNTIYQLSVSGNDGVVGIIEAATKPASLSGSESADFPKSSGQWFAINGNTITGVSDGSDINFEFTPSEE